MDEPPTKAKRKPKRAKPPEELDADLRRVLLRAAETCQQRVDENPTHYAYKLSAILEALEHDPKLIEPVYKRVQAIKEKGFATSGVPVVTAIGGVPVRRLVQTKGDPVWQRVQGRKWEGPYMVNRTRWAIAVSDADPLDVAALVMDGFPPLLKADCPEWAQVDADQVGLAIENLLDENLRSAMIANREVSQAANVEYGLAVAHAEQCDQANEDLLDLPEWKKTPAKVLRAILGKLGHPAPDNLTSD